MNKILNINNNTIYDDGKYYYIVNNTSNIKYKIDRDYKLIEHIQKVCKKYSGLYIYKRKNKSSARVYGYAYLPKIIYAFYNGKGISHINRGYVLHKDDDVTNCTIDNLYYSRKFNLDTVCRKIEYDDKYIYLNHKKTGNKYTMTYSDDLLRMLANPRLMWLVNNKNRLQAFICNANKKLKMSVLISSIAYWFYNGDITPSNFITAIRKLKKRSTSKDMTIDHLDNDIYNNCKYNLSEMTRSENISKPNSQKCFRHIFRLDMAYTGDKYILQFKYIANKKIMVIYYTCNSPKELIERIKYLKSHKWVIRHKREGEILDTETFYIKNNFPFVDVISTDKNSVEIQEWLAEHCSK